MLVASSLTELAGNMKSYSIPVLTYSRSVEEEDVDDRSEGGLYLPSTSVPFS